MFDALGCSTRTNRVGWLHSKDERQEVADQQGSADQRRRAHTRSDLHAARRGGMAGTSCMGRPARFRAAANLPLDTPEACGWSAPKE